jgi:ubiquinone/menaquinone biosynthesis C-methylase UbiE
MAVETISPLLYDLLVGPLVYAFHRSAYKTANPKSGLKVLEVGCGTSLQLKRYAGHASHLVGIDLDLSMVKRSGKNLKSKGTAMVADGSAMPFPDDSFDLVLMSFVIHEMPSELRLPVLKDIKRVLKPEGRLILTDYCPQNVKGITGNIFWQGIKLIEKMAGKTHNGHFKDYCMANGMEPLIEKTGFIISKRNTAGFGDIQTVSLAP